MRTKEQIEAILNNERVGKQHEMLVEVQKMDLTKEELECIFVGVFDNLFPNSSLSSFKLYLNHLKADLERTQLELDQLN